MRIIAVVSKDNDECTINNRAWIDTGKARIIADEYKRIVEASTGCTMLMRIVSVDPDFNHNEELT